MSPAISRFSISIVRPSSIAVRVMRRDSDSSSSLAPSFDGVDWAPADRWWLLANAIADCAIKRELLVGLRKGTVVTSVSGASVC